jgi:release factor glutamine methyltransferase
MLDRRLTGEPLAWITGTTLFCGLTVAVEPGVYVPRWQSESLARMAADLLPHDGLAVDLCAGSGAIAMVLQITKPRARVIATDLDPLAVRCARRNGVEVLEGDLDGPLPATIASKVDVMVGVLPYVPTDALGLLPHDVLEFEPVGALDGGKGGLGVVSRAVERSLRWIREGGWLLFETGSDQIRPAFDLFVKSGYEDIGVIEDGDGDPRGVYGRRSVAR